MINQLVMASKRQLDANRRNAKKSTGPKTPEGRAAVRLNGVKHGLQAETLILPGEKESDFTDLLQSFEAEHQPAAPLEEALVRRLASAVWRQNRLYRFEAGFLAASLDKLADAADNRKYEGVGSSGRLAQIVQRDAESSHTIPTLSRLEARLEGSFYKALHALQRPRAQREGENHNQTQSQNRTPVSASVRIGNPAPDHVKINQHVHPGAVGDNCTEVSVVVKETIATLGILCGVLSAQTGAITGQVADQSHSAAPHAQIVVKSLDTGIQYRATTDNDGLFTVVNLPPGSFTVTAELPGFKPATSDRVKLETGDTARVDLILIPSDSKQVVDVKATPPVIESQTGMLETTITSIEIESMPIFSRNAMEMALTIPGVSGEIEQRRAASSRTCRPAARVSTSAEAAPAVRPS